jgi:hypothetical protein
MPGRKVRPFYHAFWGFLALGFGIADLFVLSGWWNLVTFSLFCLSYIDLNACAEDLDYLVEERRNQRWL